uniref:Uncharacterized protein n=1 Tax=Oryza nivara TaxID=4536 RepID=A0A0E0IDR9_ORYNI
MAAAAEPARGSSSSAAPVRTRSVVPVRESGVSVVVAASVVELVAAAAAELDYMKEYHRELCKSAEPEHNQSTRQEQSAGL